MSEQNKQYMREWARENGKCVRQRTIRQETTKYKAGTLPLNMYATKEPVGDKVVFGTPAVDIKNEINYTSNDYSDESDGDNLEHCSEDNFLAYNNFSFLRPTRSGRNITINQRFNI